MDLKLYFGIDRLEENYVETNKNTMFKTLGFYKTIDNIRINLLFSYTTMVGMS